MKTNGFLEPPYLSSLREFLRRSNFKRPCPPIIISGTPLNKAVHHEIDEWEKTLPVEDGGPKRLRKPAYLGVGLAELAYPENELKVNVIIALYTAILLAIDDLPLTSSSTDPYLTFFTRTFFTSTTQEAPEHSLLSFFAKVALDKAPEFFLPYDANEIGLAMFGFVNGCYLEQRQTDIDNASLGSDRIASTWPLFLRKRTGIAIPYALFLFPKSSFEDITTYIKAVDYIATFVNFANDILSFHKEELAG